MLSIFIRSILFNRKLLYFFFTQIAPKTCEYLNPQKWWDFDRPTFEAFAYQRALDLVVDVDQAVVKLDCEQLCLLLLHQDEAIHNNLISN